MKSSLLSIILLSYYSRERIERCFDKLSQLLDRERIPFEFIVIDDGSRDDSYQMALELEKKHSNVRAYQLSRNYTSHYSVFAGLSVCKGACAMPMVDDEQQPYQTVVDMYRLREQGEKIIIPYRLNREDPWLSKFFSLTFYRIMNAFSDIKYPVGGADLFFIDREIIDILNTRIHPINTSSIAEVLRLGFNPYYYAYERPLGLNQKKSRWTFRKKLLLAKNNFFSASTFPIQLITYTGLLFFCLSFLAIIFYTYIALFGNQNFWGVRIPGWTSIIILIAFFGGMIMLALGVIAEYIWRIYEEVKGRPGYIIRSKDGDDEK